jgi:hypothetical protein
MDRFRTARALTLFFAVFVFAKGAIAAHAPWIDEARRLTGESDQIRANAVLDLRKTPGLENQLREAWGTPDQYLAFDVAVALELSDLIPSLLEFSARDRSGYSYHTLNALGRSRDIPLILATYRERIADEKLAPMAKMAILDSLARTAMEVPSRELRRLVLDPVPEVRESTLGYLRASVLKWKRMKDIALVAASLSDPADRIRLRAIFILGEFRRTLPVSFAAPIREMLERCRDDVYPEAERACRELAARRDGR